MITNIKCDNEDDNDSFIFDYYGDCKFVIEKNRCEINVYITENKTPYDRKFRITCTHANDSSVSVQIEIIQKADEYKLEITSGAQSAGENKYTKQLKSIITEKYSGTNADLNYNYYEKCEFKIKVSGGSKKYKIESILKCHEDTENENQITYRSFDNGFVYTKFEDRLELINYGRPFLNENDYYLVKLRHADYRKVVIELKLTYQQGQRNANRSVSSVRRSRQNVQVIPKQVSEVYMPYSEFMERLETEQNIQQQNNAVECEIRFTEDIGQEFIVVGKKTDIVLPFDVFENGEISNLMVKSDSTGNWCSVRIDETNRNLKIEILNKPICERKSSVTISIIDYPETRLNFILTNKVTE